MSLLFAKVARTWWSCKKLMLKQIQSWNSYHLQSFIQWNQSTCGINPAVGIGPLQLNSSRASLVCMHTRIPSVNHQNSHNAEKLGLLTYGHGNLIYGLNHRGKQSSSYDSISHFFNSSYKQKSQWQNLSISSHKDAVEFNEYNKYMYI